MFELFSMSLREYWTEMGDENTDVDHSIAELQEVLSGHYGKPVSWEEPALDPSKSDEEISVDVIDDMQLASLHAVAAKLELDGNLDDFEFDPEQPWDAPVFERLEDEVLDEASGKDVEKYNHLLSIGNSFEFICLPIDLPFVSQINISNDDEDEDEEEHHCDCCDEDGCCCEQDDGSIDISSTVALRRELDEIAAVLKIDTTVDIDDETKLVFDDDDPYRNAKFGWYILSAKLNEAIEAKMPLIIRFSDEDDDFDDFEEEGDGE